MIRPLAVLAAASLALAACRGADDFIGDPTLSYNGTWTGTATRTSGGERACPSPTPFVVTIENNVVRGEIRNRRDRTVTESRFDGLVDADGRLTARAWYNGARNEVSLRYNGERFAGNITNEFECVFYLRLARA